MEFNLIGVYKLEAKLAFPKVNFSMTETFPGRTLIGSRSNNIISPCAVGLSVENGIQAMAAKAHGNYS